MIEASNRGFGEIVTFYSYKGGTGRSMALANVAYILATDKSYSSKNVLMIDWDLEAPGLHRYFGNDFAKALGLRSGSPRYEHALTDAPGLVELIIDIEASYRRSLPSGGIPESHATKPEAADAFKRAFNPSSFAKMLLKVDEVPNLCLLKAGRQDDTYADRVRKFDWESFYREYGSFFTHFRTFLMNEFGFVLIDSRTGLTDVSGICTKIMPEKLVAVFVPNRQNLDGLEEVIRRATGYRSDSRDPRGLVSFPLAARIDGSNSELREVWWHGGKYAEEEIVGYQDKFERLLSEVYELEECHLQEYFDATQIPHDAHYAFGERIAARSRSGTSDRLSIGGACAGFARRLASLSAPWEALDEKEVAEERRRKAEAEAEAARKKLASVAFAVIVAIVLVLLFLVGRYLLPKIMRSATPPPKPAHVRSRSAGLVQQAPAGAQLLVRSYRRTSVTKRGQTCEDNPYFLRNSEEAELVASGRGPDSRTLLRLQQSRGKCSPSEWLDGGFYVART